MLAPHPFSSLCSDSLGPATNELVPWLDAVEVHNAQNPLPWEDHRAAAFARRHGLPGYVGTDGHLRGRLAIAYQNMPEFEDAQSFLAALSDAEPAPGRFGLGYIAVMAVQTAYRTLLGRPMPGFGRNVQGRSTVAMAD